MRAKYRNCGLLLGVALATISGLIGANALAAPINLGISIEITGMYEARFLGEDADGRPEWENIVVSESSFLPGATLQSTNGLFVSLNYEPATPLQTVVGEGTHAIYGNAVDGLTLSSGEFTLPNELLPIVSRGSAGVIDDYYINGMDARIFYQTFNSANWFSSLFIELRDLSGSLYSSLALPADIDFSQFDDSQVNFGIVDRSTQDQLQVVGRVTGIRTAQVPEPSTFALTLFSIFLLLMYRLRVRASAAAVMRSARIRRIDPTRFATSLRAGLPYTQESNSSLALERNAMPSAVSPRAP